MNKTLFIRRLAELLAGPNRLEMSLRVMARTPDSVAWSNLNEASGLFGYPTVEEAEKCLQVRLRLVDKSALEEALERNKAHIRNFEKFKQRLVSELCE